MRTPKSAGTRLFRAPRLFRILEYCEYLGSSGGYGSSGGVPEVRESGIWKFGAGYGSSGVFFFLIISKNLPLKGKFFEMVSRALPPRGVWGAWPPQESPLITRALPPQRPCLAPVPCPQFFFVRNFFVRIFFVRIFFVRCFFVRRRSVVRRSKNIFCNVLFEQSIPNGH